MARRTRSTAPVALPSDAPAATPWFRSLQVSGFTVAVFVLIVAALVILAPSLRLLVEQQAVVDQLQTEIDRWQDPAYIEAQARDRLLYVYPGDISYLVIDDGLTPDSGGGTPISDEIQSTRIDWTRALLSSIVTAGLTDLPADQLPSPQLGGVE